MGSSYVVETKDGIIYQRPQPLMDNPHPQLVAGAYYEVKTFTGCFYFWTPRQLQRGEHRPVALEFLGYSYEQDDIERVRKVSRARFLLGTI